MREKPVRSLAKAVGWRITAGLVTFSTSFYFTGGYGRRRPTPFGTIPAPPWTHTQPPYEQGAFSSL
jgi:hypothetical protein